MAITVTAATCKATVPNVNHCLRRLRAELEKLGVDSVALPKLATGVGGLDWKDVMLSIEQHLGDLKIKGGGLFRLSKGRVTCSSLIEI